MSHIISLRPPSHIKPLNHDNQIQFSPPSIPFLSGAWHITHSTLPMWKSKRNVCITYTPLAPLSTPTTSITNPQASTPPSQIQKLDDLVQYQSLTSDKIKSVYGVDTPSGADAGAWDWRGKGWLMVASSHWEVLGWGEYDYDSVGDAGDSGQKGQWMLTYFASTLFTPAGIDIYSRDKNGLAPDILGGIKKALGNIEDASIKKLVGEVFEIRHD